jgi:hypothetical protein
MLPLILLVACQQSAFSMAKFLCRLHWLAAANR